MDVAPGSAGTGARNVRFGCGASEPHQRRLGMRSGALSPRIGRNASGATTHAGVADEVSAALAAHGSRKPAATANSAAPNAECTYWRKIESGIPQWAHCRCSSAGCRMPRR